MNVLTSIFLFAKYVRIQSHTHAPFIWMWELDKFEGLLLSIDFSIAHVCTQAENGRKISADVYEAFHTKCTALILCWQIWSSFPSTLDFTFYFIRSNFKSASFASSHYSTKITIAIYYKQTQRMMMPMLQCSICLQLHWKNRIYGHSGTYIDTNCPGL